jgi:hypothetical protein
VINRPAIGIDVAKDFCVYAAISPSGTILLNPFKALNTKTGLFSALREIKKSGRRVCMQIKKVAIVY